MLARLQAVEAKAEAKRPDIKSAALNECGISVATNDGHAQEQEENPDTQPEETATPADHVPSSTPK